MTIGALTRPRAHELVEDEAHLRALAVAEPADARRQPLRLHALAGQADPAGEGLVLAGRSRARRRRSRAMSSGSPERQAQRNGPLPSQKSGRM